MKFTPVFLTKPNLFYEKTLFKIYVTKVGYKTVNRYKSKLKKVNS